MQLWGKGALGFREGIPPIDAFIIQNENEHFSKKIEKQTQSCIWLEYVLLPFPSKPSHCKNKTANLRIVMKTLDDGIQVPKTLGSLYRRSFGEVFIDNLGGGLIFFFTPIWGRFPI